MKVKVTLQFDENLLGSKWMNPDNLDRLLYTKDYINKDLLKIIEYEEIEFSAEEHQTDSQVQNQFKTK